MYRAFYILILPVLMVVFPTELAAQSPDPSKTSVVKIEGSAQFSKTDVERAATTTQQIISADGFSYYTTSGGIYLVFPKPNNNVRLFALTGQVLWSGELVSGRFYIPTGEGIYFLRVNNKSYKVSCK